MPESQVTEAPRAIPHDIPEYNTFSRATPVTEGWSLDEKYRVATEDSGDLMLRLADASLLKKKKLEFEALALAAEAGLPVPCPISFGICDNGRRAYLLDVYEGMTRTVPTWYEAGR